MIRSLVSSLFVVLWAGFLFGEPPARTLSEKKPIALVLDDTSLTTKQVATAGVVAAGGRVLHSFDDVLVAVLPADSELRAFRLPGIRDVVFGGLASPPNRRGQRETFGRAAWNAIARGPRPVDRGDDLPEPIEKDELHPPSVSLDAVRALSRVVAKIPGGTRGISQGVTVAPQAAPVGATMLNTSEFLAGAVSVNIVLVESDGSIEPQSENWSSLRENEVVSGIAAGLEWIRLQEPQAALRFVYHVFPGRTDLRARTGYEPIRRSADPMGAAGEDRWVRDVLGKIGYGNGDRFARSRAWASDTRLADGTDWAVNIFVVDSLADTDGKFADGRFAYAYIGGPHLVMTYDNQAWGIGRMDMVARHEFLHAFYAFDEYASSACDCSAHRGYLDGVNTNCTACNPTAGACVMISNGDALCDATRRHLGWADLDGDGTIDVVGQDPETLLDPIAGVVCGTPLLTGTASVVAATNRNTYPGMTHPNISVNRIAGVEVSIDGAPWIPAEASGGVWGIPQGRYMGVLPVLASGTHRIEARAVDDFGNRDPVPGSAQVVVHGVVAGLGDSVRATRNGAGGLAMSWDASGGATLYRVYRRSSPPATPVVVSQTALTSWSDAATATGYYEIRPVDACGGERSD